MFSDYINQIAIVLFKIGRKNQNEEEKRTASPNMEFGNIYIFESLFGAPPVTLETLNCANSVLSSFNCLLRLVQERERERERGYYVFK